MTHSLLPSPVARHAEAALAPLVDPTPAAAPCPHRVSAAGDEVADRLAEIAQTTEALAGDVLGLSRLLADEPTRQAVLDELAGCHRRLLALAATLDDQIEPYVHAQAHAVAPCPSDPPGLRLDLTGAASPPGWIRVGAQMTDLYCNLLWSLPFDDDSAQYIYFAMAIEHFDREHVPPLLGELRRVLRPGGVLRIVTVDIEAYIRAYIERDAAFFAGQAQQWPWTKTLRTPLEHILAWAGTNRKAGHFFEHKWAYDFETLQVVLRDAGFHSVERSHHNGSRHRALRIDHTSRDAGFGLPDHAYALFVDAQ